MADHEAEPNNVDPIPDNVLEALLRAYEAAADMGLLSQGDIDAIDGFLADEEEE